MYFYDDDDSAASKAAASTGTPSALGSREQYFATRIPASLRSSLRPDEVTTRARRAAALAQQRDTAPEGLRGQYDELIKAELAHPSDADLARQADQLEMFARAVRDPEQAAEAIAKAITIRKALGR